MPVNSTATKQIFYSTLKTDGWNILRIVALILNLKGHKGRPKCTRPWKVCVNKEEKWKQQGSFFQNSLVSWLLTFFLNPAGGLLRKLVFFFHRLRLCVWCQKMVSKWMKKDVILCLSLPWCSFSRTVSSWQQRQGIMQSLDCNAMDCEFAQKKKCKWKTGEWNIR